MSLEIKLSSYNSRYTYPFYGNVIIKYNKINLA